MKIVKDNVIITDLINQWAESSPFTGVMTPSGRIAIVPKDATPMDVVKAQASLTIGRVK